jgi:predicted MFS family arabinose efflux permease
MVVQSAELTTPEGHDPRHGGDASVAVTARDRRARVAASAGFAVQGLSFAAVISQVPVFQDKFGLDEMQLTITLAAVPVIAGVGSVLAGVFAPRIGSGPVLRVSALGVAAMMAAAGWADQPVLFYTAIAMFGFFLGGVDATMNMQGTAVQRRYGRSIMASCHAWWSIAGIVAALAAIVSAAQPERYFLGGAAIVAALVSLIAGPGLLKKADEAHNPHTAAVEPDGEAGRVPRRGWIVAFVGIALMVMFIGDAATTNWSGVFLQDVLGVNEHVVPAGLFAYLVFQFLGRTVADRIIGRVGAVTTVILGSLVAAGGFALVALSHQAPMAIGGFALVGIGLSVVVPLTFSAADALDPAGTGTVIAKVNLFNYAGVIVGSAVIGVVADPAMLGDLRLAFVVPAGLVLLIMALAPSFRVVDTARDRAARAIAAR